MGADTRFENLPWRNWTQALSPSLPGSWLVKQLPPQIVCPISIQPFWKWCRRKLEASQNEVEKKNIAFQNDSQPVERRTNSARHSHFYVGLAHQHRLQPFRTYACMILRRLCKSCFYVWKMIGGECWCALPQQLLILYLCMEAFMWWRSPRVDPESRIFAHYSTVVQLPKHVCICAKHHQIKSTSMLFQCNHRLRTVFKRCAA